MSMFHAVEARSPFLDHRLWELAASLPYGVHFKGGQPKAILRALFRKRVHATLTPPRKRGFTVPAEKWLLGPWKRQVSELMESDSLLESQGWLTGGALRAAWIQAVQDRKAPRQLWYLIVLEKWLRHEQAAA
jgi:asparagine synthase (glutamine-hydrolysing)